MSENILNEIAEYVTSNLKVSTVGNSFCKLLRETLDRKFGMILIVLQILNIKVIPT